MNQSTHRIRALGSRRGWGSCRHWPIFEGRVPRERNSLLCAQRQLPGLLCHLLRGSGLAEVQAAGDPKGETLVLSPAEIDTFIVGAVPSQPSCQGRCQPQGVRAEHS